MIDFAPVDAISRAEGLLGSLAQRNAQGPPSPEDIVRLLEAKQQAAVAVKVFHAEDDLSKKLLDVLG